MSNSTPTNDPLDELVVIDELSRLIMIARGAASPLPERGQGTWSSKNAREQLKVTSGVGNRTLGQRPRS